MQQRIFTQFQASDAEGMGCGGGRCVAKYADGEREQVSKRVGTSQEQVLLLSSFCVSVALRSLWSIWWNMGWND